MSDEMKFTREDAIDLIRERADLDAKRRADERIYYCPNGPKKFRVGDSEDSKADQALCLLSEVDEGQDYSGLADVGLDVGRCSALAGYWEFSLRAFAGESGEDEEKVNDNGDNENDGK